jgi:hypothetical protein
MDPQQLAAQVVRVAGAAPGVERRDAVRRVVDRVKPSDANGFVSSPVERNRLPVLSKSMLPPT